MELHEIRYVVAVARTRNFTRAAEQCCVSQPALTRAVQKIEHELGALLFSRERGNTHLTDLGRLLTPHFADMLECVSAAKAAAARFLRLEDTPLTVGVMASVGPLRFVAFLDRFRACHPGIKLRLREATAVRLRDCLLEGEIDVALMAQPDGAGEPLRVWPLYEERFAVALASGHRLTKRNGVRLSDLGGETWLERSDCECRDQVAEHLRAAGIAMPPPYCCGQDDWIQSMVAAGIGVCLLPEFSSLLPGVVTRPLTDPGLARQVCLVNVAGRRWSSPVAAFVAAIRAHRWQAPCGLRHEPTAMLPALS